MIPEALAVTGAIGFRFVITPGSIAMLIALGLCVAVVWAWAKKRI